MSLDSLVEDFAHVRAPQRLRARLVSDFGTRLPSVAPMALAMTAVLVLAAVTPLLHVPAQDPSVSLAMLQSPSTTELQLPAGPSMWMDHSQLASAGSLLPAAPSPPPIERNADE